MPAAPPLPDQEAFYDLLLARRWEALLAAMHHHLADASDDALMTQAMARFEAVFFAGGGLPDDASQRACETLFLLHTMDRYRLADAHFAEVVAHLARLHAHRPEAARGYARHCPDHPTCAALLVRGLPQTPDAFGDVALTTSASSPGAPEALLGLFKSQQEVTFFMAAREVFPTYFVYPNVALSCLVDFEALRPHLSADERAYYFRGVVDCVVFDQHDGYRPRFFFELDSPLHDAPAQQARDRMKDRILALAGQTLHRIRPQQAPVARDHLLALLRAVANR